MKIRLADLLGGAAWTLLVAGGVGVSTAVIGQTSPYSVVDRPAVKGQFALADEAKASQQAARSARVTEMKVELAWLADPVTSPCRLEARTVGGTLEVRGQVPNEAVLGHALQLAGTESGLRVVSKVQLNPGLRAPSAGKPQEVLHREAFNVLRQAFPEKATSIAISTLAGGEIVLKGTIPTYEDKLAISRHLRQATACSCVMNQLQVMAEPRENRIQSSSHVTTATLLTPEPLKSRSAQPVAHMPAPPSPALHTPTTASRTSSSVIQASAIVPVESSAAKSTPNADAASSQKAEQPRAATEAKSAAKPVVYRTKWRRLDPSEVAMPSRVAPPTVWKETASTIIQDGPATRPNPQTSLRVSAGSNAVSSSGGNDSNLAGQTSNLSHTATTPTPPQRPSPLASISARPPVGTADVNPVRPPSLMPPVKTSAAPMPPAAPQAPAVAKREPYVTDGVVIMDSMIKPASVSMPATGPRPAAILKTGPYVSNGVILFSEPANDKGLQANPALATLQTHLQQRIATVCGKSNKDVEVRAVTETEVAVRVKANSTLEGEELSNRIFQLPELGPCQVSLDVLVMR